MQYSLNRHWFLFDVHAVNIELCNIKGDVNLFFEASVAWVIIPKDLTEKKGKVLYESRL